MALLVIYGNNVALIDEDPLCAPPSVLILLLG